MGDLARRSIPSDGECGSAAQPPTLQAFITVMVTRSSIVDGPGTSTGINAVATGTVVQLNQSTIANNGSGWTTASGGAVTSYGNNVLSDNGASGDNAPAPATLK